MLELVKEEKLPMPQRLQLLQDEWMTAAEEGRVIENVKELAAAVNLVLRIEAVLRGLRKDADARGDADAGSEARKFSACFSAAGQPALGEENTGTPADDGNANGSDSAASPILRHPALGQ